MNCVVSLYLGVSINQLLGIHNSAKMFSRYKKYNVGKFKIVIILWVFVLLVFLLLKRLFLFCICTVSTWVDIAK